MECGNNLQIKSEPVEGFSLNETDRHMEIKIEIDKNDPWVEEVNVENYDVLGSADIKKNIEDISYTMYTCNFCPQIFTDSFDQLKHNLTHLRVRLTSLYRCDHCHQHFAKQSHLKEHLQKIHGLNIIDRLYKCNICNKNLKYINWLEHKNNVHMLYLRKFISINYLRRYKIKMVHDEKPPI